MSDPRTDASMRLMTAQLKALLTRQQALEEACVAQGITTEAALDARTAQLSKQVDEMTAELMLHFGSGAGTKVGN